MTLSHSSLGDERRSEKFSSTETLSFQRNLEMLKIVLVKDSQYLKNEARYTRVVNANHKSLLQSQPS